jgi:hypothetical protein
MTKRKNPAAVQLGRRGGKARLKKITAAERSRIAGLGAAARWGKKVAAEGGKARTAKAAIKKSKSG